MTWDAYHAAEHFTMRTARLIDRHRFAYHFQSGPTAPIRSTLAAYRNLDGGYGNGIDPDMRGHASQPGGVAIALRYLDELGPVPHSIGAGVCQFLTNVCGPDGSVPHVLPTIRHTEAAPWLLETEDFTGRLDITALICGYLHKHHITHHWRDTATAYCWKRVDALAWTEPLEAIGVCTFLQYAPNRTRAIQALNRMSTMIRAVIDVHPRAEDHVHTPLDLAPHPHHIARPLFTDAEINRSLDVFEEQQRADGGWNATSRHWDPAATLEHEGMRTIQRLRVLRAYGRVGTYLPQPRQDR
ncbi:prenyltransferase [Nocardiopsis sp. NPDC050513]|uniref:prenyltransferase n=1 Tax=Nocardiopsis sp. NPDC050513 TaxID=3364338 RepID=UPI0037AC35B1